MQLFSPGCEVQLHHRDLSSHLAENIGTHLDLLGSQNRKLQQEAADKDARITRLATELQKVQNHLDEEIVLPPHSQISSR